MGTQYAATQVVINDAFQRIGTVRSTEADRSGGTDAVTITFSIQDDDTTLVPGDLLVDGVAATTLVQNVIFAGKAFRTEELEITNVALANKLLVATYNSSEYPYLDGRQVISYLGTAEDLSSVTAAIAAANVGINAANAAIASVKGVVDGNASTGEIIRIAVSADDSVG